MKLYISPSSQESNIGVNGYVEEIYMNKVADVLCPELTRHGIDWMRNDPKGNYADHVKASNLYKPDYHIAPHSNAGSSTARGCSVFCYKPNISKPSLGTQMAMSIYSFIEPLTPVADRGIHDGSTTLSEISDTHAPAVLVEIDFHSTPAGVEWIKNHISEIAHAILLGILKQGKIAYIPDVNWQQRYLEFRDKIAKIIEGEKV